MEGLKVIDIRTIEASNRWCGGLGTAGVSSTTVTVKLAAKRANKIMPFMTSFLTNHAETYKIVNINKNNKNL